MSDSIRIRNASGEVLGKRSQNVVRPFFPKPTDEGFAAKRLLLVGTGALAARAARDSAKLTQ